MRRLLPVLLGLAFLTAPLPAPAQRPGTMAQLGVLVFGTPTTDPSVAALREGLRELGYVEGRNIVLEYRAAEGKPDAIPIVMVVSLDPVQSGLVGGLARPGGNLTGVTFASSELAAKRLQFLKEAAPDIARVGVLWSPAHPDFEPAFRAAAASRTEAIIVASSRLMLLNQQRILDLATKQRIVLVSGFGPWAQAGALLSYGPDFDALVRRAATHVDKILKGAKTARAYSLTIPPSLAARADRVIDP